MPCRILVITSESRAFRLRDGRREETVTSASSAHQNVRRAGVLLQVAEGTPLPAVEAFLGPVAEVIGFSRALRSHGHEVELVILSSLYGLLSESDPVMPYWTDGGGFALDKIPSELEDRAANADVVLVALPSNHLTPLRSGLASALSGKRIVVVSGAPPGEHWLAPREFHLKTRGVARIGHVNQQQILDWLGSVP